VNQLPTRLPGAPASNLHRAGHCARAFPLRRPASLAKASETPAAQAITEYRSWQAIPRITTLAYTAPHVINQPQLLLLAGDGLYHADPHRPLPPEVRSANHDADLVYRRVPPSTWNTLSQNALQLRKTVGPLLRRTTQRAWFAAVGPPRPDGSLAAPLSTTRKVWWAGHAARRQASTDTAGAPFRA
jgi:multicomponent Na+:H+ antiporter subunit D